MKLIHTGKRQQAQDLYNCKPNEMRAQREGNGHKDPPLAKNSNFLQ